MLFPAKRLVNFMAWMVKNFNDNTRKASAIIEIGSKSLMLNITCFSLKTFPQNFP